MPCETQRVQMIACYTAVHDAAAGGTVQERMRAMGVWQDVHEQGWESVYAV